MEIESLSLDSDEARSLGINVKKLRIVVILLSTLITATTVSVCGIIGWIGLIIPHWREWLSEMIIGTLFQLVVLWEQFIYY